MNVALVQESVDAQRGGAETSTLEMARCLAAQGATVTIVAAGDASAAAETGSSDVRILPVRAGGSSKAARTRAFLAAAEAACRSGGFDVVHALAPLASADVYQPRGGTYVETIERTLAVTRNPLVRALKSVGRRFNGRQQLLLRAERELLTRRPPPIVAAVSRYVGRQVVEQYGVSAERVRVIFNGVATKRVDEASRAGERTRLRTQWGAGDETFVWLLVAHNFQLKGVREAIAALQHAYDWLLTGPSWRLAIVGRGEIDRYATIAAERNMQRYVHFAGAASSIGACYAAADGLLHPTWYDPCSRVVLEALCEGLPVVTTRWNGAAEAIREGLDGAVVAAPSDAKALAEAMQRAASREVRLEARRNAAARREELSMSRHARELIALYEEVLREKKTP